MAPKPRKVIDCSEPEAPDSPVFDAGRGAKMEHNDRPDDLATPKLTYGKGASKGLGQSKINGYRSLRDGPIRKRAPTSVLNAKAEAKATLAGMVRDYQANHTGHKHTARGKGRKCEYCNKPLPYKLKVGTKYHPECKTAADRARTAEIERGKVFQTAASIAQEKADAGQRFYNYSEAAAEMRLSASRIGRDDVIFLATPDGVIVVNDGQPLPDLRITVYAHQLLPRNVQIAQHGHNWSTNHPDVIDLVGAARLDLGDQQSVPSTVAPIPRSSWWDGRGTALEQRAAHEAYLATLDDVLDGPERRVTLCTIADEAYLSVEIGSALEQESHWEFRFKGDPGTHGLDGYDYEEPDTTAEDIERYENRRKVLEWAKAHANKPAYTHPGALKYHFRFGRADKEFDFSDLRRIDPAPKRPPVEHLFEE
jgi:hypothetical protein